MKRFLLCNVRWNEDRWPTPEHQYYQHAEVLYTQQLSGYFSGLKWMEGEKWVKFIEESEVGDHAVFKDMFAVTRLKDLPEDAAAEAEKMNVEGLRMVCKMMGDTARVIAHYPITKQPPDGVIDAVEGVRLAAYDLMHTANRFIDG